MTEFIVLKSQYVHYNLNIITVERNKNALSTYKPFVDFSFYSCISFQTFRFSIQCLLSVRFSNFLICGYFLSSTYSDKNPVGSVIIWPPRSGLKIFITSLEHKQVFVFLFFLTIFISGGKFGSYILITNLRVRILARFGIGKLILQEEVA